MEPQVTGPWPPNLVPSSSRYGTLLYRASWSLAASNIWLPSLEACTTCSLQNPLPRQYRHLVATEARTIGKWVVRIPLCFSCFYCQKQRNNIIYILYGSNVPYPFHRLLLKILKYFFYYNISKVFSQRRDCKRP